MRAPAQGAACCLRSPSPVHPIARCAEADTGINCVRKLGINCVRKFIGTATAGGDALRASTATSWDPASTADGRVRKLAGAVYFPTLSSQAVPVRDDKEAHEAYGTLRRSEQRRSAG
jgi:hypothetical protein